MPPKKPNQSTSSPSPRPCGTLPNRRSKPQHVTRATKSREACAIAKPHRGRILASYYERNSCGWSKCIYQPPSTRFERCGGPFWVICKWTSPSSSSQTSRAPCKIPHCNMHGSPNGIQGEIQSSGKSMSSSPVGGALGQSCSYLALRGNVSLDWRPGTGLGGLGGGWCCVDMSKMCWCVLGDWY